MGSSLTIWNRLMTFGIHLVIGSVRLSQTLFLIQTVYVHSFRKLPMNKNTSEAICKKRRAWTKLRHCNNAENCDNYKFHRNQCRGSFRKAKHDYEKNICLNVKD